VTEASGRAARDSSLSVNAIKEIFESEGAKAARCEDVINEGARD
jgi:hypothetical protein